MNILEEAYKITTGDRRESYGTPESSFGGIAALWNAYLGNWCQPGEPRIRLDGKHVAIMMLLMKVAREQASHKRDNVVDMAGYANCLAMLHGDDDPWDSITPKGTE